MKGSGVRFDVVANNLPFAQGFQVSWGNACLIRRGGEAVLFDTGCDGEFLRHNLERLKVAPSRIKTVVISHDHDDHTGGLWAFLASNRKARVFAPAAVSRSFKARVRAAGAKLVEVQGPVRLAEGIHSLGAMRGRKREQALAVKTPKGLAVLTGCAHPGVSTIVARCVRLFREAPRLVLGGFHLKDAPRREIDRVIARLRRSGVERVAPNHCTGALARRRFKTAWGKDYVETGCGAAVAASRR